MIETIFKSELVSIGVHSTFIDNMWNEIETCYNNTDRYYHNLTHLNQMITELLSVKEKITDWRTIVLSTAYHDIIYKPIRQDNEEKSADLACKKLDELRLPDQQKIKCRNQIVATKKHERNIDQDTNYFIDADLSILGAEPDIYQNYTKQIRKEYKYYPDLIYKPGRKKVLRHFLEMREIFKTAHFRDKYEHHAKSNITAELEMLS